MEILLGMAIIGLVAEAVIIVRLFQKQIEVLNDRLASKSIEEFKYYQTVYPKEVKAEEEKQKLSAKEAKKQYSPADAFRRDVAARS